MNDIRKKTPGISYFRYIFCNRWDLNCPTYLIPNPEIWRLRVFEDADYESELNKKIKIRNGGFNMVGQN